MSVTALETDAVVVRRYSRAGRVGLTAAAGLMTLVAALLMPGFWSAGWSTMTVVSSLVLLGLTAFALTIAAASVLNTIRIHVAAGDVVIESGPVPWTSSRVISAASVEQLYVQQAPLGKPFWPSLGGPYDVKARLSDGRWITMVPGCCTAEDAQRVERLVEQMLDRRDEYGEIDDDERSEVFADWQRSLGPRPSWLRVEQQDALVNIRCRETTPRVTLHTAAGVVLAVATFWILFHWSLSGFDAALCVIVAVLGVVQAIVVLARRRIIIVNATHIARSATWPLWKLRQVSIERRLIHSLDCRSRTVTKRLWKRHVWSWDRRYNSIRYRRYWVVAYNAELGHFRITEDLRTRREALHLMNEIGSALKVIAATTPWSDHGEDEARRSDLG